MSNIIFTAPKDVESVKNATGPILVHSTKYDGMVGIYLHDVFNKRNILWDLVNNTALAIENTLPKHEFIAVTELVAYEHSIILKGARQHEELHFQECRGEIDVQVHRFLPITRVGKVLESVGPQTLFAVEINRAELLLAWSISDTCALVVGGPGTNNTTLQVGMPLQVSSINKREYYGSVHLSSRNGNGN